MENENPSGDVIAQTVPAQQEQPTGDVITEQVQVSESVAAPATQTNGVSDVDENGVPFKNRYFEMQRKYEDVTKSLPTMIQEAVLTATKAAQAQSQPQYTVQDYATAMAKDPEHAPYYQTKIAELQKQEIETTVKTQLTNFQQENERKSAEAQAFNWATSTFPQLANPNDPLSQLTWQMFNQRPAEKRLPTDFALAAELAANRLGIRPATAIKQNQVQQKLVQKEREIKQLVKQTSLEGGGRPSSGAPDVNVQRVADLNEALNKGDMKDYLKKYVIRPSAE
jgi:hypothetical protein